MKLHGLVVASPSHHSFQSLFSLFSYIAKFVSSHDAQGVQFEVCLPAKNYFRLPCVTLYRSSARLMFLDGWLERGDTVTPGYVD